MENKNKLIEMYTELSKELMGITLSYSSTTVKYENDIHLERVENFVRIIMLDNKEEA